MHKKTKKMLTWILVVSMVLTNMLFSNMAFAATKNTALASSRLAGADRYQTAVEISKAEWTTSEYAVLAYGEGFADALAAGPLAAKYDAPILLTEKDSLPAAVLAELQRLGVKNVFIVGGEGVVSAAVADALTAAGMTPERLSGADRYATALAVANKLGTTTEVVVAYGENYPDALSIAAIAAAKGMPILLTDKDAMSADVKAYIGDKKAYVVGGEGVVSAAVFNGLTGAVRLSGADRYATNLAVLQQFAAELNWLNVFVATGEGFADALAGSALAARYGSPVVLAGSSIAAATASFLTGKVTSQTGVIAFGGAAVVSDAVVASVKPAAPTSFGVESVSAVGLGAVKVVFTQTVDEETAENVGNYQLDGVDLATANGDAVYMASDKKTVYVFFGNGKVQNQYAKALFTVEKNVISSEDTLTTAPKFEQELTFSDTTAPAVKAVTVTGNKKISVQFTEPVSTQGLTAGSQFKIDGQYLTNFGYNDMTIATTSTTNYAGYTDKINLNFSVAVPAGSHTLTVPKGSFTTLGAGGDYLSDYAGFKTAETTVDFTVESVTGAPSVVSVTGENNGVVYVTYNRAMDKTSAVDTLSNYYVNNNNVANEAKAAEFKTGSGDTVVKLTFDPGYVNKGYNVLVIKEDTVKDAFGNKLDPDNDVRVSFSATEDTTKPTVVSVVTLDSDTLRVKFSEKVAYAYASNLSNYTLKDSNGINKSSTYLTGVAAITPNDEDSDVYTIDLADDLQGSNYTLTIKNIQDLAYVPNIMDEYIATVSGVDDTDPSVDDVVKVSGSNSKITAFFDEAMDVASITDKANYAYKGADGSFHSIPSSTSIKVGEGNKYVTLEFPTGYTVYDENHLPGGNSQYDVIGLRVANAKDTAGNILSGIVFSTDTIGGISETTGALVGPEYVADSFKMFKNSSKVWAEFELDQTITNLDKTDFVINGVTVDSAYRSGRKIVIEFTNTGKMDSLKAFGTTATLATVAVNSTNEAGVSIQAINAKVYDEQIAPSLASVTAADNAGGFLDTITLTFNEAIDQTRISNVADDLLISTANGSILSVDYAVPAIGDITTLKSVTLKIKENTTYTAAKTAGYVSTGDTITVKAKKQSEYHVFDIKDSKGDQNTWSPSDSNKDTGFPVVIQ